MHPLLRSWANRKMRGRLTHGTILRCAPWKRTGFFQPGVKRLANLPQEKDTGPTKSTSFMGPKPTVKWRAWTFNGECSLRTNSRATVQGVSPSKLSINAIPLGARRWPRATGLLPRAPVLGRPKLAKWTKQTLTPHPRAGCGTCAGCGQDSVTTWRRMEHKTMKRFSIPGAPGNRMPR